MIVGAECCESGVECCEMNDKSKPFTAANGSGVFAPPITGAEDKILRSG